MGADVLIIGAGVVGCAIASRLSRRGRSVMVLERDAREGTGTTSRNSGVVHAGLYYPPGSVKARTCREGLEALYAWAQSHGVEHRQTGKLVVARTEEERPVLETLLRNAHRSGATECELIGTADILRREPSLPSHPAAIWSPRTGIVDAHGFCRSLLVDAERHGAVVAFRGEVLGLEAKGSGFRIDATRGDLDASVVINAAGLFADEVAAWVGVDRPIHPCRGDYFRLRSTIRFRHLVYPVKHATRPDLGVHLTIDVGGGYRIGPDSQWVDSKTDFRPAPHKHSKFLASARRLLGPIAPGDLRYDGCGLRPKLTRPGEPAADFELVEQPSGCFHLLGIESPGLTAALALARCVEQGVTGSA